MKKLLILSLIAVFSLNGFSQVRSWNEIPINPVNKFEIEMIDGKVYQLYWYDDGSNTFVIDYYDPSTMTWKNAYSDSHPYIETLKTEVHGDYIYILGYDLNYMMFNKFNTVTKEFSNFAPDYFAQNINNNFEFHVGKNPNEVYVLYTVGNNPSTVFGLELLSGNWSLMSENTSEDLSQATLQIQSTDQQVYFGVGASNLKISYFNKGNIATMFSYDGLLGNVLFEGNQINSKQFQLIGNLNNYAGVYVTENSINKSFERRIENGTGININNSEFGQGYNLLTNNVTKSSTASHAFIFSKFSDDGEDQPHDKLQVIGKDLTQQGSIWQAVSSELIDVQGTEIEENSVKMAVDNFTPHLAVSYNPFSINTIKVLNFSPYLFTNSDQANTGLCANQLNEIYSNISIMDDDFDRIRIIDAYSLNFETENITVIPFGFIDGVSKFKILGKPTASPDQIVISYTDGFGIYYATLGSFSGNTSPVNIQFVADPVVLCKNELKIDLANYLNYYDFGNFRINGQDINGSEINANRLEEFAPIGTIRFIQNINGCIITANAGYEIYQGPSASVITTNTTCIENNGSATANIQSGFPYSYYWSNGLVAESIEGLAPGAYYLNVFDEKGCKATALGSVLATDITVTIDEINQPLCGNDATGSVTVAVSGTQNYQVVWSNGVFGNTISNLTPGNYECTLYDQSGCQIKKTYLIQKPNVPNFNFNTVKPGCNQSNGSISLDLQGGSGPFTYSWNTGSTNQNLSNLSQGFYQISVTDANNCIYRDSLFLNNLNPLLVVDSILHSNCGIANGGINISIFPESTQLNEVFWSNGSNEQDQYSLDAGDYLLTINYDNNCVFQKNYKIETRSLERPEICVVTVDEETTTNLVVWEKDPFANIDFYSIYRENTIAGTYTKIDTIHYSNISVFNDVIASPLQRSWRYRISATNSCGVESPLSIPTKTLHLNIEQQANPQEYKIFWDTYEGTNQPSNYNINRFTEQEGWISFPLPTQPFGAKIISYDDEVPIGSTGVDYYVSFDLTEPCTATFRAQDFNVVRSNKDRGIFNPGQGTTFPSNELFEMEINSLFNVYPNPFDNFIIIDSKQEHEATLEIFDIQAKKVSTSTILMGQNIIDLDKLAAGLYNLEIKSKLTSKRMKLVKY
jgi:hypothetical protein